VQLLTQRNQLQDQQNCTSYCWLIEGNFFSKVMFYSTSIFRSAGLSAETALFATIGMGAINVGMTIVSVILVEKAGRRTLLLVGYCGMTVFVTLLTMSMLLFVSLRADHR
jgi:hypothetical protein